MQAFATETSGGRWTSMHGLEALDLRFRESSRFPRTLGRTLEVRNHMARPKGSFKDLGVEEVRDAPPPSRGDFAMVREHV